MQTPTWPPPESFIRRNTLALPEDVLRRLADYLGLLLAANTIHNLTAVTDVEAAWNRHILESIASVRALTGCRRALDLGSGGGLPGIPIAIVLPELHMTLLESTGKKARFLSETCAALQLPQVEVLAQRAETEARNPARREQYDAVTCRAVGSLAEIMELAIPFLKTGGRLLAIKGRRVEEERAAAQNAFRLLGCSLRSCEPLLADDPENESVLLCIEKNKPTDRRFPRPPGTPKKSPL